ncbi:MAG TPA: glycosyltransferase family protein [Bacteroidota bacterium]|jgi:spore coat polysaccharide biosynthesis protein SpsF|nr:glycosyltransferase family protein [Bacteroidota bacterium]
MKKINIVTIIQARTGSSRLPNKVLFPLGNKNVLLFMLDRVKRSKLCGKIVVATTQEKNDDSIEMLCSISDTYCYRGDTYDLLDRHYKAAKIFNPDAVVKIPSDCPLIDPKVIDRVIHYYILNYNKFDYVSNLHPQSYPDGNDVEIFSFSALEKAWKEAKKDFEREHTTPYFWENPDKFKIGNILWETGLNYSLSHRWTLDYLEDYDFIRTVVDLLFEEKPYFDLYDILNLLEKRKDILLINNKYLGVNWYRNHISELKTININETRLI